jgi:hypothetical protein
MRADKYSSGVAIWDIDLDPFACGCLQERWQKEVVPVSGIYRCDNDEHDDHRFDSTDVRGHRFPPLPGGCRGNQWVLERATAHH